MTVFDPRDQVRRPGEEEAETEHPPAIEESDKGDAKSKRTLRSSLSAQSFKAAFKMGTSNSSNSNSVPKSPPVPSYYQPQVQYYTPPAAHSGTVVVSDQASAFSYRAGQHTHHPSYAATHDTSSLAQRHSTYARQSMESGELFGVPGEPRWSQIKSRIIAAMKDHAMLVEGTPMQWISSLNISWSSGVAYIRDDGSIKLQGEAETLELPDLRLVKVISNLRQRYIELVITPPQNGCSRVIVTPTSESDFFRWTAALLLWSNLKPAGLEKKVVIPALVLQSSDDNLLVCHFKIFLPQVKGMLQQRRISSASVVKRDKQYSNYHARKTSDSNNHRRDEKSQKHGFTDASEWISAVGVLKYNGVFELLSEADGSLIQSMNMQTVLSSRVRKISPSLFNSPLVLYIQPTEGIIVPYSPPGAKSSHNSTSPEPYFYARFETEADYEDWFTTLKNFTRKRIFSPTSANIHKSLRVSRQIHLRIIECKVTEQNAEKPSLSKGDAPSSTASASSSATTMSQASDAKHAPPAPPLAGTSPFYDSYVEVEYEKVVWARTFVAWKEKRPFWREDFMFEDFPVRSPNIRLVVKRRLGGKVPPCEDPIIGYLDLPASEIEASQNVEKWYALTPTKDMLQHCHGASICLKIRYEEIKIMAPMHYQKLHQLLTENVNNYLTMHIAEQMPSELGELSEVLLKVFQTENRAVEWITSLIGYELDKLRETFTNSPNYESADFKFSVDNTLFRGNSMVSKVFERYMKLVGHSYLDSVIGSFTRKLIEAQVYLEVDATRVYPQFLPQGKTPEAFANENHARLDKYATYLWRSIRDSTAAMPYSFRILFKRLRLYLSLNLEQEDSVIYNAVSGFLFLRFFCPALLNPKLTGLVRSHPPPHVQRSLTLVAKMIQGLANRVRFGLKEPAMLPMNEFIDRYELEMTEFYKEITLTNQSELAQGEAWNERPVKEQPIVPIMGDVFSNPYLIDELESYAKLVEMWSNREKPKEKVEEIPTAAASTATIPITTTPGSSNSSSEIVTKPAEEAKDFETVLVAPRDLSDRQSVRASVCSSAFEEAMMDVLEEEKGIPRPKSRAFDSPTPRLDMVPKRLSSMNHKSYADLPQLEPQPQAQAQAQAQPQLQEQEQEKQPQEQEKQQQQQQRLQRQQSTRRNTLNAIQEEAFKAFELEVFSVRQKLQAVDSFLQAAEMIDDNDLNDFIAHTSFTYNPETGHITLSKYAAGIAQAALQQRQGSSAANSVSGASPALRGHDSSDSNEGSKSSCSLGDNDNDDESEERQGSQRRLPRFFKFTKRR
ncbi:hypothetical protein TRVA0_013S02784 [Trichomonascus vanleenenianus]|uniref:uncharacterized protein n=1 Tax=Trichomonascus vanleenenianus TaxID=2268995 RepID=UPI003ECA97C9